MTGDLKIGYHRLPLVTVGRSCFREAIVRLGTERLGIQQNSPPPNYMLAAENAVTEGVSKSIQTHKSLILARTGVLPAANVYGRGKGVRWRHSLLRETPSSRF